MKRLIACLLVLTALVACSPNISAAAKTDVGYSKIIALLSQKLGVPDEIYR